MNVIRSLGLILSCVFFSHVHAGEARDRLNSFLNNTDAMQAKFQQKLLDSHGLLLQQSAGDFMLQRPGKFVWDYSVPYPQKIVSNGERIWVYDAELEQVSIKKYDQVLSGAPVMLLEKGKNLDLEFRIEDQGLSDGLYRVVLMPRSSENEFREVRIALDKKGLRTMSFVDAFEQTTIIEFEHVEINPKLDSARFEFQAPPGTDIVGDY